MGEITMKHRDNLSDHAEEGKICSTVDEASVFQSLLQDGDHDDRAKTAIKKLKPGAIAGRGRMKNLDGARGIGVLTVVLYHMGFSAFQNAWLCISFFFTLSGFLITAMTVEAFERKGDVEIIKFWAKRVSRLFPALFLVLIAAAFSHYFREDDGITFARERTDMLYSTFFLTNYNLIYQNKDDYFDAFAKPSITRHMWTLSIEEQYYIIWPLIIYLTTYLFGQTNTISGPLASVSSSDTNSRYLLQPHMRRCFWALSTGECLVIAGSFWASRRTINTLGVSAAYYSTLCRMGDIACGGLVYNLMRLHPALANRYLRVPHVPPMTKRFRILLECMTFGSVMMSTLVPMIPIPTDQLLSIYFAWLRLPLGLAATTFRLAGTIQLTEEPLPRWAWVTRFLSWEPMMLLGTCSYGIYLLHWPIIVILGDRYQRQDGLLDDSNEILSDFQHTLRNGVIMFLSIALGIISYRYYEKPLVQMSMKTPPLKTIFYGFCGMALTSSIILVTTRNVESFSELENDVDRITNSIQQDDRFTPVHLGLPHSVRSHLNMVVLDENSRGMESINRVSPDNALRKIRKAVNEFAEDGETSNIESWPTSQWIIMCQNWMDTGPCLEDTSWPPNTYWVWLNSTQLCGSVDYTNGQRHASEHLCDEKLHMLELNFENEGYPISVSFELAMLRIDTQFPRTLNQNMIERLRNDFEGFLARNSGDKGHGWKDRVTITVLGESIGQMMGKFWQGMLQTKNSDQDMIFPVELFNMAMGGQMSLGWFLCLSEQIKEETCFGREKVRDIVLEAMSMTRPDIVVVHDQLWSSKRTFDLHLNTPYLKILAMRNMLETAKDTGVKNVIFMTISGTDFKASRDHRMEAAYLRELNNVLRAVEVMGCSKQDSGSILFTVFDWTRLVCPDLLESGFCSQSAHGFEKTLKDGVHPTGEAGKWLSEQALSSILSHIATLVPKGEGFASTTDASPRNPWLDQFSMAADTSASLDVSEFLTSYYLCPKMTGNDNFEKSKVQDILSGLPSFHRYTDSKFHVKI